MVVTAYYGLFRVGEITESPHVIKFLNVHVTPNKDFIIFIYGHPKLIKFLTNPKFLELWLSKQKNSRVQLTCQNIVLASKYWSTSKSNPKTRGMDSCSSKTHIKFLSSPQLLVLWLSKQKNSRVQLTCRSIVLASKYWSTSKFNPKTRGMDSCSSSMMEHLQRQKNSALCSRKLSAKLV